MHTRTILNREQNSRPTTILRSFRVRGRKEKGSYSNQQQTDTILLTQLSDEDAVVLEIRVDKVILIIASMDFDINRPLAIDLQKNAGNPNACKRSGNHIFNRQQR